MNAREGFKIHSSGVDKYCDPPIIEVHHYSFKTHLSKKDSYMVRVERFPFDLYIVKFFKRDHKSRKDKYNVLTNEGIALRVIYTCVGVALDIHRKNPNASFGFVGSPTEKEKENKTLYRTKRFRVYEKFASFYFSPENYEHAAVYEKSGYLILNRKKLLEDANMKESILDLFESTYNIDSFTIKLKKSHTKDSIFGLTLREIGAFLFYSNSCFNPVIDVGFKTNSIPFSTTLLNKVLSIFVTS